MVIKVINIIFSILSMTIFADVEDWQNCVNLFEYCSKKFYDMWQYDFIIAVESINLD